jgi:hypothetical protein
MIDCCGGGGGRRWRCCCVVECVAGGEVGDVAGGA